MIHYNLKKKGGFCLTLGPSRKERFRETIALCSQTPREELLERTERQQTRRLVNRLSPGTHSQERIKQGVSELILRGSKNPGAECHGK